MATACCTDGNSDNRLKQPSHTRSEGDTTSGCAVTISGNVCEQHGPHNSKPQWRHYNGKPQPHHSKQSQNQRPVSYVMFPGQESKCRAANEAGIRRSIRHPLVLGAHMVQLLVHTVLAAAVSRHGNSESRGGLVPSGAHAARVLRQRVRGANRGEACKRTATCHALGILHIQSCTESQQCLNDSQPFWRDRCAAGRHFCHALQQDVQG
jgi:hypothetical protein